MLSKTCPWMMREGLWSDATDLASNGRRFSRRADRIDGDGTHERLRQIPISGGSKILQEVQQSAVPDFKRIAQRAPDG